MILPNPGLSQLYGNSCDNRQDVTGDRNRRRKITGLMVSGDLYIARA